MHVYFCEERYLILSMKGIKGPHSFESIKKLNLCIGKSIIISKWVNITTKGCNTCKHNEHWNESKEDNWNIYNWKRLWFSTKKFNLCIGKSIVISKWVNITTKGCNTCKHNEHWNESKEDNWNIHNWKCLWFGPSSYGSINKWALHLIVINELSNGLDNAYKP